MQHGFSNRDSRDGGGGSRGDMLAGEGCEAHVCPHPCHTVDSGHRTELKAGDPNWHTGKRFVEGKETVGGVVLGIKSDSWFKMVQYIPTAMARGP